MKRLGVWWWDGFPVADIEGDGRQATLRYTREARDRWSANAPVVSCSLPLQARRADATAFLRGLLPEGQHLAAIAAAAELAVTDTIGLLARYGRDIAGALVISDTWPGERPGAAIPYSDEALVQEVAELEDRPLGIHDDSELSIAGIQNKLLLIADGADGWARPAGGAPSTHILKTDDRRRPGLIRAEAAATRLARHLGLTSIDARQDCIGEIDCLILSRFDRRIGIGGAVERIHQEDACQALNHDPEAQRGRGKYERAGGPSFRDVAELLDVYAPDPLTELDRLVAAVTFTVLIGNADAHGKNLGLLHPDSEHAVLAPLYDLVPTVLWPELRREPAMSIGSRVTTIDQLGTNDIVAEAKLWPHESSRAAAIVEDLAERALDAITNHTVVEHERLADLVTRNAHRLLNA